MPRFETYKALNDEANQGWVWQRAFARRAVVTISRTAGRRTRKIFCVARQFDSNFLERYNAGACKRGHRHKPGQRYEIDTPDRALVMGQWYRQLLAIPDAATGHGPETELVIKEPSWCALFPEIRAACQQPDLAIRIGTRLGILGGWLGLTALIYGLLALWLAFFPPSPTPTHAVTWAFGALTVITILLGLYLFRICRIPE